MPLTYFKRFRMEIDLRGELSEPVTPVGYRLSAWRPELLESHADAKYLSFCNELDAVVFPCLGTYDGCQKLMREISCKSSFLPSSTWLASYQPPGDSEWTPVGTVQGLRAAQGYGAIQNLGLAPDHRSAGVGTALLLRALSGFQAVGLRRAYLEVTAKNRRAVRLYQRLGFRHMRTLYKAIEVVCT